MGAELLNVIAICNLAEEARLGYFKFDSKFQFGAITQEDHRREPDLEETFRLTQERGAARTSSLLCSAGQMLSRRHWDREK
jgi:hypothetical protein